LTFFPLVVHNHLVAESNHRNSLVLVLIGVIGSLVGLLAFAILTIILSALGILTR
jgi:uncharacterized membrane protein YciS (DUF1049 family)